MNPTALCGSPATPPFRAVKPLQSPVVCGGPLEHPSPPTKVMSQAKGFVPLTNGQALGAQPVVLDQNWGSRAAWGRVHLEAGVVIVGAPDACVWTVHRS